MKKFLLVLLLLNLLPFTVNAAPAGAANRRAIQLIERMKTHPLTAPAGVATPLLNFSSSPKIPIQGQNLTWFVQFDNPFSNRGLSIDATLNGVPLTNIYSPSKGLFLLPLGRQNEVGSKTLEVTLFVEDTAHNADVRAAIAALDVDINRLTNQINAQRDPVKRAVLQEQRAEKLALKNELVTQLKQYRYKLGTQAQNFTVVADPDSSSLPKITGISPVAGNVHGGTPITISGMNFTSSVTALLGGIPLANVVVNSDTSITADTPDFGNAVGMKDLELRFQTSQGVVNVVSPLAFYAGEITGGSPQKPVAVASGSQMIRLGNSAQLDGSQSYDTAEGALQYEWKIASVPNGSNYSVGDILSTEQNPVLSPSAYGTYVVALRVPEADTPEHLTSDPSVAVVQVDGSPVPSADAVEVVTGQSGTTQVFPNSPRPGIAVFFSISQNPQHGTVSVSPSGLVTFTSTDTYIGGDSFEVKVTDQSGLIGTISIPVNIIIPPDNQAPVVGDLDFQVIALNPYRAEIYVRGSSDPDGSIASLVWDFGDGTPPQPASVASDGQIFHDFQSPGNYLVTVTLADNFGVQSSKSATFSFSSATEIPALTATANQLSGPTPLTVELTSNITSASPLTYFYWAWGDGGLNIGFPGPTVRSHTYADPGVYTIYLVVGNESGGKVTTPVKVYAGVDSPPGGSEPVPVVTLSSPRYSLTNTPFLVDGSLSFDPNPGAGPLAGYLWSFRDFANCVDGCTANTVSASHTYTESNTYYIGFDVTGAGGTTSLSGSTEIYMAHMGLAPRSVLNPSVSSGVAPLRVDFGSSSFDYDGSIEQHAWNYNDPYGCPEEACTDSGPNVSHTYSQPGVYFPSLSVKDNDNNNGLSSVLVIVNPGYSQMALNRSPRPSASSIAESSPMPAARVRVKPALI